MQYFKVIFTDKAWEGEGFGVMTNKRQVFNFRTFPKKHMDKSG